MAHGAPGDLLSPAAGTRLGTMTAAAAAAGGKSFFGDGGRGRGRGRARGQGPSRSEIEDWKNAVSHAPVGAHGDRVNAVVVSRDGTVAVTGSSDREIKVWDVVVDKGKDHDRCVLLGHTAEVRALCLTNDRRLLFSGDASGVLMIWDGMTFDHILTVQAHDAPIQAITYTVVTEPPVPTLSRCVVVFTATDAGAVCAWNGETGMKWEMQPPERGPFGSVFSVDVRLLTMQYVAATPTPTPPTAVHAPVDSGIFPASFDVIRRMERSGGGGGAGRRGGDDLASVAGSAGDNDSVLTRASEARRRGGAAGGRGGRASTLSSASAATAVASVARGGGIGGRRGGRGGLNTSLGASGGGMGGGEPATPAAGSTPASGSTLPPGGNPYRMDRANKRPDPAPTLDGVTTMHERPRIFFVASSGRLLILDLFTMRVQMEEDLPTPEQMAAFKAAAATGSDVASLPPGSRPPSAPAAGGAGAAIGVDGGSDAIGLGLHIRVEDRQPFSLGAAAMTADGTRIAFATDHMNPRKYAAIAPVASLTKADVVLLEPGGSRTKRDGQADEGKKKGDGAEARQSTLLDPAAAKRAAEEKVKAQLARVEARRRRKEEKKAAREAKKAEKAAKAAAAAAKAAAKGGSRRGSAGAVPEPPPADEEEDDDDSDDDDSEGEEAAAKKADKDSKASDAAAGAAKDGKEEGELEGVLLDRPVTAMSMAHGAWVGGGVGVQ